MDALLIALALPGMVVCVALALAIVVRDCMPGEAGEYRSDL